MLKMRITYNPVTGSTSEYRDIPIAEIPAGTVDENGNPEAKVGIVLEAIDDNRDLLTITYNDDTLRLSDGQNIMAHSEIVMEGEDGDIIDSSVFDEELQISHFDPIKSEITAIVPHEYALQLSNAYQVEEDDGAGNKTQYIEFEFDPYHYYTSGDDRVFFFSYTRPNGQEVKRRLILEFLNEKIMRIQYNQGADAIWDEIVGILFPLDGSSGIGNFVVTRPNFQFDTDNASVSFQVQNNICITNIPLMMDDFPNILGQDKVQTRYIDEEKEKAVNKVSDMEKDRYQPVIRNSKTGEIDEVYSIEFNLHFLKRDKSKWKPITGQYWNGTENDDGGPITFNEEFFPPRKSKSETGDLLGLLNFNNEDIIKGLNKLKKSFITISFYDSMNPGDQNLLSYSMLFFDVGFLYSNYLKYNDRDGYKSIQMRTDNFKYTVVDGLEGIGTGKELSTGMANNIPEGGLVDDYRFGARMVANDSIGSMKTAEGFYFYQFKDYSTGHCPGHAFMKVEFNHAGYGSTIPFMMPYYDPDIDGMPGIRSFENIVNDWNNPNERYKIKRYRRFSYIRFRYMFDKDSGRNLYYLDDEKYGNDVYFKDNKITLNLYEAKLD